MRIIILHDTKDEKYKIELEKHLTPLDISIWDTSKILPGTSINEELYIQLTSCDYVLALLSVDFISNDKLLVCIRDIHFAKQTIIIPILLRNCLWMDTEIGGISALPKSGIPIIQNNNEDGNRLFELAKDIRNLIVGEEYQIEISYPIINSINLPICPYPGITWFHREDAGVFFGRDKEIRDIIEIILDKESNIILLHGKSGVGKSSLLHAGIIPRLEKEFQISYHRRTEELDPVSIVESIISNNINENSKQLIVIDQLEEIYTKPNPNFPDEKERLAKTLKKLNDSRKNTSIILGFRKEYYAEFKKLLDTNNVYYLDYYIEPLGRLGVIEAIIGVVRSKKLLRKYHLQIEDELIYTITRDILKDNESNYAPFLQILLRKMWDSVEGENPRAFTLSLYNKFKRDSLSGLIDTQISELSDKYSVEVEKGLVLDLLDFYTSPQLTALSKSDYELLLNYEHIKGIVEIKNELVKLFLLTDNKDTSIVRLAHDSLAPIINQKYIDSQTIGQQASRHLNFSLKSNTSLTKEGMMAALNGKEFRRIFSKEERGLVEDAKKRYYKPVIREYIAKAQFREAINLLYDNFSCTNSFEDYIMLSIQSSRYYIIESLSSLDLITEERAMIEKNKFKNSLYELTNSVRDILENEKNGSCATKLW